MVTTVYLLSSFADPADDVHWASPYHALSRAFSEHPSPECRLVDSPAAADLILICPRPRNPVFPSEIFRGGIAWKYRHKCVVVSTDDNPTVTHKGFYTSLRAGGLHSPLLKGGFYPLAAYEAPNDAFPIEMDFRYLFSFLGSFATHAVRRRIGALATDWPASPAAAFLIKDTTRSGTAERSPEESQTFRSDYRDALRESKFILCPRGMCPSSVRLFETMKAGRVPVVISDDWVRPPEVRWDEFAITVREKDVASIPSILSGEESTFAERAAAARRAWDSWFAKDVLARTVTRWGVSVVDQSRRGASSWPHLAALWTQIGRWHFFRRGVLSELRRAGGGGRFMRNDMTGRRR
jgi:hypothetical protein